jgi:hypothetical protein
MGWIASGEDEEESFIFLYRRKELMMPEISLQARLPVFPIQTGDFQHPHV